MLPVLGRAVFDLTGVRVPADAWNLEDLPPHLRFFFRVVEGGKTVGQGRDLAELLERFGGRSREAWAAKSKASWEREGLTGWTFDTLPEELTVEIGGARIFAYPALIDGETSVALRPLGSRAAADAATRAACGGSSCSSSARSTSSSSKSPRSWR